MSSTDPATWRPVESAFDFWNERSFLAGILIGAVAYGVHATLFFITLSLLWKKKRTYWRDYTWITYVLVLFTISSIANYGQLKFTQMIWVDNRDYPGGPSAYLVEQQTAFEAKLVVGGYMVNGWLQDGLILYRFWIIFGGRKLVVFIPALIFLGTIAASTGLMVVIGGTSYFTGIGAALLIAYYALSVALNLIATVAITTKLWMARRQLRFVSSHVSSSYVSIAAILIESACLYTVCGVIFLIPFGLADPFQNVILPTLAQVESIAPLLIIMRVAQGQAWSSDTTTKFSSSTFTPSNGKPSRYGVSVTTDIEHGPSDSVALSVLRNNSQVDETTKVGAGSSFVSGYGDGEGVFPVTKL